MVVKGVMMIQGKVESGSTINNLAPSLKNFN